jgi:hypothetical protein
MRTGRLLHGPTFDFGSSFGIMSIDVSPSTGSLRIAIADRGCQPFGTLLLTTCLQ